MKKHLVLGIMSGTSLDGVDYALCEMRDGHVALKGMWSVSYPSELRKRIMAAASGILPSYQTAQLHHDLGRFYARHAPRARFDYIGMHGQTVFHNPKKEGATFQIGEPAYLAARFNVPVISQFRTMDLALGGQGAPLATAFHEAVFGALAPVVAVNNLGGISNVTYLPGKKSGILSFDTGPANMLIDQAVLHVTKGKNSFDGGGKFSSRGIAHQGLIQKWLKHPFFKKRPPKSTGREEFGSEFFGKILTDCKRAHIKNFDLVATLTEFTAQSIALSYEKFLPRWPQIVVLCGGGAMNPTLVQAIRKALRASQWLGSKGKLQAQDVIRVTVADALGWPTQSIEASAFAWLAYLTMNRSPGNLPQTTGARRAAVLGQITPAP